jgi:hypothetical protein
MASLPRPPSDLLPDHSGAYIVKETQRAAEGRYENPIQAGIEATHANYDRCATLMLETAAKGARSNAVSPSHRPGGEGPVVPAVVTVGRPNGAAIVERLRAQCRAA